MNADVAGKELDPIVVFGHLAAALGRLVATISSMPAFKKSELNVSEWVTLFIVQQNNKASNKQLAKRLGVTRQRIHQILAGLIDAGLIVMRTSPEDSRRNEISLTEVGTARLRLVNDELGSFLTGQLGSNARSVDRLYRQTRRMVKIIEQEPVQPAQPQRTAA